MQAPIFWGVTQFARKLICYMQYQSCRESVRGPGMIILGLFLVIPGEAVRYSQVGAVGRANLLHIGCIPKHYEGLGQSFQKR